MTTVVPVGGKVGKDLEEAAWPCVTARARGDGEDQRHKGLLGKDLCGLKGDKWPLLWGQPPAHTGCLFSQAFCLSVEMVLSGLACPGRAVILTRFPDFLWMFQYLSMPCVCQINPTAQGLLGFHPICAQMGSDGMLGKGVCACWPAQCWHTLPV